MESEVLTLEKFAYGGEAMGRLPDGRALFVPHALPGEEVRVRLVEDKPRYARGELLEVLTVSKTRIQPRCKHSFHLSASGISHKISSCGGCHYQHIPYEEQLIIKGDILCDQLQRIGKIQDPPLQPSVPSPQPWNYRNHIQFHPTAQGQLGFQAANAKTIIPIDECHLPEETINQLWPQLDLEAIPGLDRVGIRLGFNDDLMVILQSSDPHPITLNIDLPISVVHLGPGGSLVLAGDDHIVIEVNQRLFRVSPGSFFQINTVVAERMVAYLLAHLPLNDRTTLIDAYCGVGLFSAFLAPKVGRLIGIESSPTACEDFTVNLDEFDHVDLYEAAVEIVLGELDLHPHIMVIDPPRSGLARQALDGILSLAPHTLAYISCDPATLGRDAKRLIQGGYQLQEITPFDLFPQTYHIESISFWTRN